MSKENINRLKVVLIENIRTAKWLAEQVNHDPVSVSKWCSNTVQPILDTLVKLQIYLMWTLKNYFIFQNK